MLKLGLSLKRLINPRGKKNMNFNIQITSQNSIKKVGEVQNREAVKGYEKPVQLKHLLY